MVTAFAIPDFSVSFLIQVIFLIMSNMEGVELKEQE